MTSTDPTPPTPGAAMGLAVMFFGALVAAGGVIGFVTASSWPSLLAGGGLGVGLGVAGLSMRRGRAGARTAALLLSLAVAGVMAERFVRTEKAMPAFPVGGLALALAALLATTRPRGG